MIRLSLWLHNIRSVYNLGSVFRTAEALGVEHIYLSGYTPHPIDRFGRIRSDLSKTALGAEERISWSFLEHPEVCIHELKKEGVLILGLEQDSRALNIFNYQPISAQKYLLALGEETKGMEEWQRNLCDQLLEIPMLGEKESLNVSVACAVALYELSFGKNINLS
jgi:23S rRNA (guanosine2251-2'-O)-methyltransferase